MMAFKKYLVILVLTLVAFACAENSEPMTSNSTSPVVNGAFPASETSPSPTTDDSFTSTTDDSFTSTTDDSFTSTTDDSSTSITDGSSTSTTDGSSTSTIDNSSTSTSEVPITPTTTTSTDTTAAANATENVCVLITLDLKFNNNTYKISSDDGNKTDINCSDQSATVRWGKTSSSSFSFYFNSDAETKNYMISEIILSIDASDNYENATADEPIELVHKPNAKFKVPIGNSYSCSADRTTHFFGLRSEISAQITTSNLQIEAFRNSSTNVFSSAKSCINERALIWGLDINAVIVIAVACVLLVAIGLIAFWRKRSASNASYPTNE